MLRESGEREEEEEGTCVRVNNSMELGNITYGDFDEFNIMTLLVVSL